ncbi:MAG: hypothetical protein H7Y28_09790 [Rhodoferax sp.]|nr:hypothetical protein [Rhodoferax sp.]
MAEAHSPHFASAAAQRYSASIDNDAFRNRSRTPREVLPQADVQFLALVNAYQATGGLAWIGDLESMFMLRSTGSAESFSDAVADRQVVHFEWQNQVWLPLFQFDLVRMQTHSALAPVLDTLNGLYNDWDIAEWFSRVNPWLKGRSPAQTLVAEPAAVLDAASAEVFVARG